MIKETNTIINKEIFDKFKRTEINEKNLRFHIQTIKSALKILEEVIKLSSENNEKISDNIAYVGVLRLRESYIVACLLKNKMATIKGFLKLNKITSSISCYKAYLRSNNNERNRKEADWNEIQDVYSYSDNKIKEQEKWIRKNTEKS